MSRQQRLLALLIVFLFPVLALSQTAPPPKQAPADYSKEASVIEYFGTRAAFESDGTSRREITARVRIQAEAAVQSFAVLSFSYTSSSETVDVDYVRVRKPDGSVVTTPAYNIQDMPADVTRSAPMYSDIHEKHVTVKGLAVGDVLEYHLIYRTTKPEVPGQFWFNASFFKDTIILNQEIEISLPRGVFANVSSPNAKPQITDEGGRKVYRWKASQLARKEETDDTNEDGDERPTVQVTSFPDWETLGHWYSQLQAPQSAVTPQIQAKAAELVKGLTDDRARIEAIYKFVSTRIHYVSLSFGIGRYQPHPAGDVLENEYGDCKDKHTLLTALLKAAGYDAWPVLVNSSRKIDPNVPSPLQFDHIITAIPRGKDIVWLDTTAEVAPYGLILAALRDKQALVLPTGAKATLMTTPADAPFPQVQKFTADAKLGSDGTLTGHFEQVLRGDVEVVYRQGFRRTPPSDWKPLVQRVSYALGFGGEVSEITASDPDKTGDPFRFSYDYTRKKYSDWENRRITPPLPMILSDFRDDDKPLKRPFRIGAIGEISYQARIELPAGTNPAAPPRQDLVQDFAEYHASYAIEKGVFTASRTFIVKKTEIGPKDWDSYKKFRKAVVEDGSRYLPLDRESVGGPPVENPADYNPEAVQKFREGLEAMQRRDALAAQEAFRRAIELDPKLPGAHGNLGVTYLAQNDADSGIRELRKEEELSPNQVFAPMALAQTFVHYHRYEEAVVELRKALKIDSKNLDAAMMLAGMLRDQKNYTEAISVLETALDGRTDKPRILIALGQSYLYAGQTQKGVETIQKAVGPDSDPDMLNMAAYILALGNAALDLAQEYAESAIHRLERESLSIKNPIEEANGNTRRQIAYWDTLGWIYFRLGKFEEAHKYLRAPWNMTQDAVGADHIAQVYEKQGKVEEAAHMYRLAFACQGIDRDKDAIRKRYEQLPGKRQYIGSAVSTRRPDGTFSPFPYEEMSRARTVKISSSQAGVSGSAVFGLVLSPGKVEEVRYLSGKKSLETMADQLKAKVRVEFPGTNPVRIVRRGILACSQSGCDFSLLLVDSQNVTLPNE